MIVGHSEMKAVHGCASRLTLKVRKARRWPRGVGAHIRPGRIVRADVPRPSARRRRVPSTAPNSARDGCARIRSTSPPSSCRWSRPPASCAVARHSLGAHGERRTADLAEVALVSWPGRIGTAGLLAGNGRRPRFSRPTRMLPPVRAARAPCSRRWAPCGLGMCPR